MTEIKPTWKIAKQISRQHTLYSLAIILGLMLIAGLVGLVVFKLQGDTNSFAALLEFVHLYQRRISSVVLIIYLVPVNFYAIILTLQHRFRNFHISLFAKELI